ncbi:MAG: hypothetical protein GC168_00345 [Candidatus Hydrogenedens sp.]|nr:hypothetical protein [Candidatus Hydrogenedens sp.]
MIFRLFLVVVLVRFLIASRNVRNCVAIYAVVTFGVGVLSFFFAGMSLHLLLPDALGWAWLVPALFALTAVRAGLGLLYFWLLERGSESVWWWAVLPCGGVLAFI